MNKLIPWIILCSILLIAVGCGGSKNNVVEAKLQPVAPVNEVAKETPVKAEIDPIQSKYAALLDMQPEKLESVELYNFIDKWMDAPYLMGGENEKGIDCSAFVQHLYVEVYDYLPERTAAKQKESESTEKFIGQEFLKEGDLLFFKKPRVKGDKITHVGVYLGNNMFVSASGYDGPEKKRGVKLSDLNDKWWQERFVCAGRKPLDIYVDKEK